MFVVYSYDS